MISDPAARLKGRGVSVITCTKRANYIDNIFRNYTRQTWRKKELIIIINNDNIPLERYRQIAKRYKNVAVFKTPQRISLGRCLNMGIIKAKHAYVAKFDDDDYYAPSYLTESMQIFNRIKVDVVGKKAHYAWLEGKQLLILRFPNDHNKRVQTLPGATLVFKKAVFNRVRFSNVTKGEDDKFCKDCSAKGYKLFSGSKNNFVALRRKFSRNHTWIITEKQLLSRNVKVLWGIKNYKKFVAR